MSDITYENLRPIIADEQVRGLSVQVVFQCPLSGHKVSSSASIQAGVASKMRNAVSRSLMYSLRSSLASMVRSLVGGGTIGYMASSAMYAAAPTTGSGQARFTEKDRQRAVVEAFLRVQNQFLWDATRGHYVAASVMQEMQTDFARMLGSVSIQQPWDRGVLARILAEIAASDGQVGPEEREFFSAFSGAGVGSIDDLVARPPLTSAELQEVSPAVREVMLMLAYAVAYSDQQLEAQEVNRLQQFAAGLGIAANRAQELARHAAEHVVDSLLEQVYADGHVDQTEIQQVNSLAGNIGVDSATLARLDARCRKRKGII